MSGFVEDIEHVTYAPLVEVPHYAFNEILVEPPHQRIIEEEEEEEQQHDNDEFLYSESPHIKSLDDEEDEYYGRSQAKFDGLDQQEEQLTKYTYSLPDTSSFVFVGVVKQQGLFYINYRNRTNKSAYQAVRTVEEFSRDLSEKRQGHPHSFEVANPCLF